MSIIVKQYNPDYLDKNIEKLHKEWYKCYKNKNKRKLIDEINKTIDNASYYAFIANCDSD